MTAPSVLPPAPTGRIDPIPVIAANATAIVGMVALHWSPQSLLFLYALDTALSLYAMGWLVIEHVTEAKAKERGLKRALKFGGAALVVGSFLNLVLVAPLVFVFAEGDWVRSDPWRDAGFQTAMAMQLVGSIIALVRTHRMLNERDDDEPYLAAQFMFLVARWIVVLGVLFFGVTGFLGDTLGCAVLVLVYAGASVWFTLFPEKAYELFHPKPDKPRA